MACHNGTDRGTERKNIVLNSTIDWKSMEAAIGNSDFKDVRDVGAYFVDKSELIDRILRMRGVKALLFTRPRRFGKSLNLSMIDAYLNLKYKGNTWFDGLKISDLRPDDPMKNASPVIRLDMKDFEAATAEETVTVARTDMSAAFRRYRELEDSDKLSSHQIKLYGRYCDMDVGKADVMISLQQLSEMLEAHYGRKPVLLLDEYDVPIQSAWEHRYYDEAIDFFREFYSAALKTNPSLDFAVMTGVLRIAKENIFSALNNLKVDSVLQMKYPEAFGFTTAEVEKMTRDLGCDGKMAELREWYDGYQFAGKEIYNPWSVVNYFDNGCHPSTYWVHTSGNAILGEMLRHAKNRTLDELESVLQGGHISAMLQVDYIYSEIYHNRDALYTMLVMTGYLTMEHMEEDDLGLKAKLVIPNHEILEIFQNEFGQMKGKENPHEIAYTL